MRSKIFQAVLDDIQSESWWYRLKLKLRLKIYTLKLLGVAKYLKLKK